jgi:hypothetical protein
LKTVHQRSLQGSKFFRWKSRVYLWLLTQNWNYSQICSWIQKSKRLKRSVQDKSIAENWVLQITKNAEKTKSDKHYLNKNRKVLVWANTVKRSVHMTQLECLSLTQHNRLTVTFTLVTVNLIYTTQAQLTRKVSQLYKKP